MKRKKTEVTLRIWWWVSATFSFKSINTNIIGTMLPDQENIRLSHAALERFLEEVTYIQLILAENKLCGRHMSSTLFYTFGLPSVVVRTL